MKAESNSRPKARVILLSYACVLCLMLISEYILVAYVESVVAHMAVVILIFVGLPVLAMGLFRALSFSRAGTLALLSLLGLGGNVLTIWILVLTHGQEPKDPYQVFVLVAAPFSQICVCAIFGFAWIAERIGALISRKEPPQTR